MSKTVDERVVSMQFDNKQFEANVQTSMSTLDKLKQKLNFEGASKGLENVNAAAKNVNMSGLSSAVETVSMKFSALQVMAVTALANITNSAINAGKRIVHALTIAPITTGFQEYELKMNSVQTIMASTGESLETVNEYLEELNKYADKTIYSFSDMTSNIGKFTNAGVKLEDAVMAIKGISNEAAVSGANANEASRAMYNFAQALSAGYVKLIDWKSIENANMATVEFKNQLIQTAVELGTLTMVGDKYQSTTRDLNGKVSELFTSTSMFNESLSSQWMTTEVLVETLKDYADETTDIGKKAYAAAQDVKTFTQLFDTLKEAAQSGWAQTWELIIGDFDEAKEFLTGLSNTFGGIIDAMSEARNKLLGGALNSKWDQLLDKINAAGISAKAFQDKLKETAKKSGISIDELIEEYGSLSKVITSGKVPVDVITKTIKSLINAETTATESTKELGDIVDRVIKGEFGTTQSRWIALTEAGYDWAEVQNLVNERLGSSVRHLSSLTEEQVKNADSLSDLSDEQLKNKGYTDEQIQALRDLKKAMDEGGTSINDLIKDLEKPSGRELLLESLSNIINAVIGACKALSKAWKEIFPPLTSDRIYNLIEGLNKLTSHLRLTDEETGELNANGEKLKRTFKGILAVLDIVRTIVGGALSVAFKILSKVLGAFDLTILDVTAGVGDAIVKFRDWLYENSLIAKVFNKTVEVIVKVAKAISKWFKEFSQLPAVQNTIEKFKETFTFDNIEKTIKSITKTIKKWIDTLMQIPLVNDIVNKFKDIFGKMSSVGSDLVEGFKKGLNDNSKTLWDVLVDFAKGILQKVRDVLGIESPSTETHEDGKNCILGFIEGIKEMLLKLWAFLKGVASKTVEVFKKINWSSVFAGGLSIGFLAVINKFANAFEAITSPMEGTGKILNKSARKIKKILNNVAKVVKSFSKLINSIAFEHTAKGIKDLAISLAILVGAIIILTYIETDKLWNAVEVIGALAGILVALSVAVALLSKSALSISKEGLNAENSFSSILSIALSLLMVALVVKMIGSMDPEKAIIGFIGLKSLMFVILEVMVACALLTKGNHGANANQMSKALLSISIVFWILASVVKKIGKIKPEQALMGLLGLKTMAFTIVEVMAACALLTKGNLSANANTISTTLLAVAGAFFILGVVAKMLATMTWDGMGKAAAGLTGLTIIVGGLIGIVRLAGNNAPKIGFTLFGIATAIAILAWISKLIAGMSWEEMGKAAAGITGLSAIVSGLISAVRLAGNNAPKIALSLTAMAVGIAALAVVAVLLSSVSIENLAKGITAVGLLGGIVSGMVVAARGASDCYKNLIVMAVIIALLAAIVYAFYTLDDTDKLYAAVGAISIVFGAFALILETSKNCKDIKISTLVLMLGAVLVLSGILILLSELKIESCIEIAGSLALLMIALSTALLITSNAKSMDKKQVEAIAAVMLALVGAIALIGLILAMVNALGIDSSIGTVFALVTLLEALSVALVIVSNSKSMDFKQVGAIAAVMLALVGVIALIGLVLAMLNQFEIDSSIGTVFALATLLEALSVALVIVSHSKSMKFKQVAAIAAVMLALVGAMALIGLVLVMMTVLPVKNAMGNALVLSGLLIVLTGVATVLSAIGFLGSNILKGAVGLAALTVVMALLGLVLVMMTALPVKNAMGNAIVLSTLLIVLTGVASVLAVIGFLAPNIVAGAVGLAALTVVMALIGLVLAMMVALNIKNASEIVTMLSGLLMCMANVCVILALVGPLALIGVTAMAALEALMIATAAFAVAIGSLMTNFPELENFLNTGLPIMVQIAGAIGEMIGAFMEAVAESLATILPVIGKALSDFILYATPFIVGIKMVDESVLAGAGILAAAIIALTVSELIAAIGSFLGIGFVALGIELSAFMFAALPFIAGLKTITPEDAEAASNLAALIEAITVSSIIDGIASFLGIESLGDFGAKLSSFGGGMKAFSESIADLSDEDLARVKIAAEAGKLMAEMSESIPKTGGWVQKILGASDMVTFSESIVAFGEALVAFGTSVSTLSEDDYNKISIATDAGTALSDLNNSVPKTGGWAQKVLGSKDMTTFGNGIIAFGECLVAYADIVNGLSEDDITAVRTSADVGKTLSDFNDSIPKTGGWAQKVLGSKDMTAFGNGLIAFGRGLKGYITSVKDIDGTSIGYIIYSGNAVDELKEVIDKLPKSGGIGKSIFGGRDPAAFGDGIRSLGLGISSYISSVKSISDNDNAKISKSKDVIEDIAEAIEAVPTDSKSIDNTSSFIVAMSSLATNIVDYIDNVSTIDDAGLAAISTSKDVIADIVDVLKSVAKIKSRKVSLAVTQIQNLADSISGMTLTNFSGADKFKTAIDTIVSADFEGLSSGVEELGEVSFSDFVSAFEESASKVDETGEILTSGIAAGIKSGRKNIDDAIDDITVSISSKATKFYLIGARAMKNFADGILTQTVISKKAVTSVINACRDTANAKYRSFYNVGKYLVQGFASGIKENTFIAEVAASAMAKAAYKAAKEALDIHSPSKIFRKLGFAIPEGLAMGIDKLSYMVGNSVISMTKSAINGTKDAISRIASIVTNDIDAQPTIRPVLDLSDVRSGANAIGNMLNGRTLSIATRNVGTINSMMKYNQNGANSDVISAIEDLGRKLGNTNGNTYNINGITYDDGSDVSDAIETLIRAAKIERRS